MPDDKGQTMEDRATQPMDTGRLSFTIVIQHPCVGKILLVRNDNTQVMVLSIHPNILIYLKALALSFLMNSCNSLPTLWTSTQISPYQKSAFTQQLSYNIQAFPIQSNVVVFQRERMPKVLNKYHILDIIYWYSLFWSEGSINSLQLNQFNMTLVPASPTSYFPNGR